MCAPPRGVALAGRIFEKEGKTNSFFRIFLDIFWERRQLSRNMGLRLTPLPWTGPPSVTTTRRPVGLLPLPHEVCPCRKGDASATLSACLTVIGWICNVQSGTSVCDGCVLQRIPCVCMCVRVCVASCLVCVMFKECMLVFVESWKSSMSGHRVGGMRARACPLEASRPQG